MGRIGESEDWVCGGKKGIIQGCDYNYIHLDLTVVEVPGGAMSRAEEGESGSDPGHLVELRAL